MMRAEGELTIRELDRTYKLGTLPHLSLLCPDVSSQLNTQHLQKLGTLPVDVPSELQTQRLKSSHRTEFAQGPSPKLAGLNDYPPCFGVLPQPRRELLGKFHLEENEDPIGCASVEIDKYPSLVRMLCKHGRNHNCTRSQNYLKCYNRVNIQF